MTGRFHPVFSGLFLIALLSAPVPAAFALDADPVLLGAPDKKPFVMTVMGVRKAFAVAPDRIRVEIGIAANTSPLSALNAYRIVSEDDPEFAYEKFVRPESVSFPTGHLVTEAIVPEGFRAESAAANITSFSRETADLKLHAPMKPGRTYSVVIYGYGPDVISGGRTAAGFVYDPADIQSAPEIGHKPDLMTLTALGLRGLDSVGNGVIRLEFGPSFYVREGYRMRHYHVTLNGEPVGIKAMGRRSEVDLYKPTGWPFTVVMRHEIFLQLERAPAEGDIVRVEVDPAVVSGANAAEMKFSDRTSFSSAIKVNQVGYIAAATKTAMIGRWMGSFPDEGAVLATPSGEDEGGGFRDISADEVFFGASGARQEKKDEKTDEKKGAAPEKGGSGNGEKASSGPDSPGSGNASAADHEFSVSSLRYDAPPMFEIRDARTHEVVFSGRSRLSNPGNRSEGRGRYSGENAYEIDFTAFKTPGRYYIAVPGTGRGFEFEIAPDVYGEAFRVAAYGVFAQRCGIALEPPYSDWRRIACHDSGIQLTDHRQIDNVRYIDLKKVIYEKNPSPEAETRPAVYAGPDLIAHFPFDGSAANSVPGGMTLSPLKGAPQSFKVLPNLIWDGAANGVFETKSGQTNGWTGKLNYDRTKGLTVHFWMRRNDGPKGSVFDGDIVALRTGSADSFRMTCTSGTPAFFFNGAKYSSGARFGDDAWHCRTFVLKPGDGGGPWTLRMYLDGALLKTATAPASFSPGGDFLFGSVSNTGAEGCFFDELRIYNRALSDAEVAKLAERIEATVPKRIPASGGHHDAGDYNPRSHIDVAQVLLDAYELAPRKFYDGQLNIPEKDNGIPDILDEALWALRLWIGLQDEDGGVRNGTESDGDPNFFQTVDRDPKGDFAYAKDSRASFLFAGAMAQASRLLKSVGKTEMAADYLRRARRAYDWGVKNRPRTNNAQTFGFYYTVPLAYAAAQLYHTTGEAAFHEVFLDNTPWKQKSKAKMIDDNYDLSAAAYAYAAIPPSKADPTVHSDVVRAICEEADMYVNGSEKAPYKFVRNPYAPINWGTGAYEHFLTVVWHAWAFAENKVKAKTYRDAMIRTADNTLGCNPLNLCWITGLGSNCIHAPLHNSRFNPTGFAVPGMQAQGPDNKGKEYNYTATLYPIRDKTPPLYCFVDAIYAIEMDEGTVQHQAETMAVFGLLLPDMKRTAEDRAKGE